MEKQLLLSAYVPTADIMVMVTCIVIGIVLATSYSLRSKSFMLFVNMIVYIFFAAAINILLHYYHGSITDGDYTGIYVLKIIYHAILFSMFLLYIVYLVNLLRIDKKQRTVVMSVSGVIYLSVLTTDIVQTVRTMRIVLSGEMKEITMVNTFMVGYIAFISVIIYLMLRFGNRLYRKALIGCGIVIAISFLVLFLQAMFGNTSYTVATFLFPTLYIMYILHTNPFDIKTGTVDASALAETVDYFYKHNQDFYFLSINLIELQLGGNAVPGGLQKVIRSAPSWFFKKTVLFKVNNGHLLLLIPARYNPDCEDKLASVVKAFNEEYNKYHFSYKVIFGRDVKEISERNEYLGFIRNIHQNMAINSIHVANPDDVKAFNKSREILHELEDIHEKQDLNDERVLAYCQPVFNIETGEYDTAEALMRLKLPEIGLVFPNDFIHLAEENGYIHTLTKIILNKTCGAISSMEEDGYELKRVSINVAISEMKEDNFTKDIEEIITSRNISYDKIAIEITESQIESDFASIKRIIGELKGIGVKIYLDDFGTGYSNMERIMQLPFDIIKFDRSLVLACQNDERSQVIVGGLASMFSRLHYSILFEGIETEKDELRCIDMSASYLQGYKYSRPIPIDAVRAMIKKIS